MIFKKGPVNIKHEKKHSHSGKSSQSFLQLEGILNDIGLRTGDRILDVGCGNGYVSLFAASISGEDGIVYAVDSDPMAIDALNEIIDNRSIKNIVALKEDVTQELSIAPCSIDFCLMINVFHGFVLNDEWSDVFRNVNQVLKEQGKLVIIDFKKGVETPGPPQNIRIARAETIHVLLQNGFKCLRTYSPGPYHYGLIFIKSSR